MTSLEHARRLLRKAAEDDYVLRRLVGDPAAPIAAIGFHAQQAIEKMLKAVLAAREVDYPRTHDLRHLVTLLRGCGRPLPTGLEDACELASFAARFRYDESLPDAEPLDRPWVMDRVGRVRQWAEGSIGPGQG